MKTEICFIRVVFSITLSLTAFLLHAEDYTRHGGAARRAALGGINITLPDVSVAMDLYEEGYVSSLVLRKKQNMISTSWIAMPHEYNMEAGDSSDSLRELPVLLAGEGDGSAGFTYSLDNDNTLQFRPYLMINEGWQNTVKGLFSDSLYRDFLENMYAADIVFSRKITKNFSGGAGLRAAFYRDESVTQQTAYINYDIVSISGSEKIFYSKAEYSISCTYAPDENASAAVSFGTLKALLPYFDPWISGMKKTGLNGAVSVYPSLFSGYSYSRSFGEKTYASLWESSVQIEEKQDISGYDINAGCSVRGQGQSVFTASAGLTLWLSGSYSVLSNTVVDNYFAADTEYTGNAEYVKTHNGQAHHVALKGRYDFGAAIAAGKFTYSSAGADLYEASGPAVSLSSQIFDVSAGIVFLPDRFVIPVEIFAASLFQSEKGYVDSREADFSLFNAGLKGGVEYEIASAVFMRLGFDASYGGPSSRVKTAGGVTGSLLGTSLNPAYAQAGINFGAGHYNDNIEINLNLRFSSTGRMPANAALMEYNETSVTIMTDVKIFL
jgi:hypothetical protein